MPIRITGEAILPASDQNIATTLYEQYTEGAGLRRIQHNSTTNESDFAQTHKVRYSDDNGRTWGQWSDIYAAGYEKAPDGSYEISTYFDADVYNPVHRHFVGIGMQRIYRDGHEAAYKIFWQQGELSFSDHCFLLVRPDGSEKASSQLLKFEPGPDFDPQDPLNGEYFIKNFAYFGKPAIAKNGDVLFAIGPRVSTCCRMLGIDVKEVFPTKPDIFHGLIIGRGKWNGERYDVTFSCPVVIGDLQSSRGVDEPLIAELESGRILVVFRGSNMRSENWGTRIEPGTPGFKWYCYSDDGGKTLTQPAPWHFDDGEVVYSSATLSYFLRSCKTGKLYWFGNITDHNVDGSYPRWPLQIVEVDETYGTAKKDTLTVIDTRRAGESEFVQLSNFVLLDDRETGNIQLWLSKIGQYDKQNVWRCESWKYTIKLV